MDRYFFENEIEQVGFSNSFFKFLPASGRYSYQRLELRRTAQIDMQARRENKNHLLEGAYGILNY